MLNFILASFLLSIAAYAGYRIYDARKWMKNYGDGNYNPLRRTYINAGIANKPREATIMHGRKV